MDPPGGIPGNFAERKTPLPKGYTFYDSPYKTFFKITKFSNREQISGCQKVEEEGGCVSKAIPEVMELFWISAVVVITGIYTCDKIAYN